MPSKHDKQGIKSNIHIVLTGPDGKIKDERTQETLHKTEVDNEKKTES